MDSVMHSNAVSTPSNSGAAVGTPVVTDTVHPPGLNIVSVRPAIKDLCDGKLGGGLTCDIDSCQKILPHSSALKMHRIKTHGIFDTEDDRDFFYATKKSNTATMNFYCPVSGCVYHTQRHFPYLRYLKQHYLKVHGEKRYQCEKCGFCFAIESHLNGHVSSCGVIYKCAVCSCPYTTKAALMTHCRRQKHEYPQEYKSQLRSKAKCPPAPEKIVVQVLPIVYMLPVSNTPTLVTPSPPNSTRGQHTGDQSTGTQSVGSQSIYPLHLPERFKGSKNCMSTNCLPVMTDNALAKLSNEKSVDSQFGSRDKPKIVQGTQTSGNYILKQAMTLSNIPAAKQSRASQVSPRAKLRLSRKRPVTTIETQTQALLKSPKRARLKSKASNRSPSAKSQSNVFGSLGLVSVGCGLDSVNDTETQTLALLEELEKDLSESTSTQTLESFLSHDIGVPAQRSQHSSQTQTMSFLPHCTEQTTRIGSHDQTQMMTVGIDQGVQRLDHISGIQTRSFSSQGIQVTDTINDAQMMSFLSPDTTGQRSQQVHHTKANEIGPVQQSSAEIQTNIEGIDLDLDALLSNNDSLMMSSASSCDPLILSTNTETQTVDDILNQFLIDMETQTANTVSFPELSLQNMEARITHADIGTQDSISCESVEIQTRLHGLTVPSHANHAMSTDMETQTLFPDLVNFDTETQTLWGDLDI